MDLPTYTNIWRIEKRLYKLYDFRLPAPLPISWIAVFTGITVPYIVFLVAIGIPFNHNLVWLYVLPPGLLTWLTTRPVIEYKRLPELLISQTRYLTEPRVWCRLAPLDEKDEVIVVARVWHSRREPVKSRPASKRGVLVKRDRAVVATRTVAAPPVAAPRVTVPSAPAAPPAASAPSAASAPPVTAAPPAAAASPVTAAPPAAAASPVASASPVTMAPPAPAASPVATAPPVAGTPSEGMGAPAAPAPPPTTTPPASAPATAPAVGEPVRERGVSRGAGRPAPRVEVAHGDRRPAAKPSTQAWPAKSPRAQPPEEAPAATPPGATPPAAEAPVPSIERALGRDPNGWRRKVKVVTGTAQGPGKRDMETLDRNRARLPLNGPRRILVLGCTSGAGQTVTALMSGYILASLREQAVAAVDLHDGTLATHIHPAGTLSGILNGHTPEPRPSAALDGLPPGRQEIPGRLDVITADTGMAALDEVGAAKLAQGLGEHYPIALLDPGPNGLTRLLGITDQLIVVVPASAEAAQSLASARDWLDAHGFADLAARSVTLINGVSRRSMPDVEAAESVARGRCRAIVRVPWDDALPVGAAGPTALLPQTRVAYTALAGVLVAGMAAPVVRAN